MKPPGRRTRLRRSAASKAESLPRIAISMGDPGGIGPEVALKALRDPAIWEVCEPALVGDVHFLRNLARLHRLPIEMKSFVSGARPPQPKAKPARAGKVIAFRELKRVMRTVSVYDGARVSKAAPLGRPSREGGAAAGRAIEDAVKLAMAGEADGIVTAPISKESLAYAGYGIVGHTELLAKLTGTKHYAMMMVNENLRVVFATTHIPLRQVSQSITVKGLVEKLVLAEKYLRQYIGLEDVVMGVCCLNPHCGEGGQLSDEEGAVIEPAVVQARRKGLDVHGPYPADSVFWSTEAWAFDAILAMYHDQGMIPIKRGARNRVVNMTLGLPFVRTSPGHGTAFDLSGQGRASEEGMVNAIMVCARIADWVKRKV
jgi:4-hydroxythreonine-4-phosphate dehydrogenase